MAYDAAFVKIDDEIRGILYEAYILHGRSYHALSRTLNFAYGSTSRALVKGKTKHINREKLMILRLLVEK